MGTCAFCGEHEAGPCPLVVPLALDPAAGATDARTIPPPAAPRSPREERERALVTAEART